MPREGAPRSASALDVVKAATVLRLVGFVAGRLPGREVEPAPAPRPAATRDGGGARSRFRDLYGSSPLHLVAMFASLAITAYAAAKVVEGTSNWPKIALWFLAAAVLHDIVFFPLYALLDRIAGGRRLGAAVNFVRAPALVSGLLLAISLPLVFSRAPETYEQASGLRPDPYLERWLAVTAVLFLGSGLLYAIRARRGGSARAASPPPR